MITPEHIDPLFAALVGFGALVAFFILEVRAAQPDPHPEYSPLDRADGLDSRAD